MRMPRWLRRMGDTRQLSQRELEADRARTYIRLQCFALAGLLSIVAYVFLGLSEMPAARKAAFIGLLSIMGCVSIGVIVYESRRLRRLRERE